MHPNNMEFLVTERIAERYAEGEQYRLGQEPTENDRPRLKHRLGKIIYRLGCRMIDWSEMLQYHGTPSVEKESERLTV